MDGPPRPVTASSPGRLLAPTPPGPCASRPASPRPCPQTEALATAAVRAATKLRAALIVVMTVTGRTARLIAKYRPHQPILTVGALFGGLLRARSSPRSWAREQLNGWGGR
jgi:hypothetical protein